MTAKLNVITGATGLLGSHVAEKLRERGKAVRALVRPASDCRFLEQLGVELVSGDTGDVPSLRRAVAGADVVYHCAGRVTDWGPWAAFGEQVVEATRNVLEACRAAGVGRVLHVSSLAVYGHPRPDEEVTEDSPLGRRLGLWEHYARAKILAEGLARDYGPDLTVIRPGWFYGPRDRASFPRVVAALQAGRVPIVGSGDNLLSIVYVDDVAEGAVLAATHPAARGRVYNLASAGDVTQERLINTLAAALGLPPVTRRVPRGLVYSWAFVLEAFGRLRRQARPPALTRKAVSMISRTTRFSTARARSELGWRPQVGVEEGVRRTLDWYFGRDRETGAVAAAPGG